MNGSKSTKEVPKGVLNLLLYESNPWKQRKATGKKGKHQGSWSTLLRRHVTRFHRWNRVRSVIPFCLFHLVKQFDPKTMSFLPASSSNLAYYTSQIQPDQWTSKHPLAQHRVCVQDCPSASEHSVGWHQAWSQVQLSLIIAAQQIEYARIKPTQPMQFE